MGTLTPLHDELDASLNRILDHDTVAALHSQARREFLDSYSSDASTVMQWLEPHLKKAREDALPHRYMRPDPEDDA